MADGVSAITGISDSTIALNMRTANVLAENENRHDLLAVLSQGHKAVHGVLPRRWMRAVGVQQ